MKWLKVDHDWLVAVVGTMTATGSTHLNSVVEILNMFIVQYSVTDSTYTLDLRPSRAACLQHIGQTQLL